MSTVIPTIGAFVIGGEFDDLATGRSRPDIPIPRAVQRDPADPLKYVTVGFTGIPANTEVRIIRDLDDSELGGIEDWVDGTTFSLPYFGSANSGARWVFIHVDYEYLSFDLPIPAVDQTIPVVMRRSRVEAQA